MLDRVVRLSSVVRFHSLVKLLESLFRELPRVFSKIDKIRVAALDTPGERIFLGVGAGDKHDLGEGHRRSVGVNVDAFREGLVSIVVYADRVFVRDQVIETKTSLPIRVTAIYRGAAHVEVDEHGIRGEVAS